MLRLRRKAAINQRIAHVQRLIPTATGGARAALEREHRELQAAKAKLAAPLFAGCDEVCQACVALAL